MLLVLALVAVSFWPSLNNGFTNWDDTEYLTGNWTVRDPSWAKIRGYFSSFQMGLYHPLTLLSLALDHRLFGLDPRGHHAVSLLLHLLNTALVYTIFRLLGGGPTAAALGALLFGIHPLRVESVAWISGRKEVLCAFFFLGGLAAYLEHFTRNKRALFIWLSFALFVFALLAKPMAVSFPLVLILCDYLYLRKFDRRAVLEKVPFFCAAAIFGWVAYLAQMTSGGFRVGNRYTVIDNLFISAGGIVFYLVKTVLPLRLSALYPYPAKTGGNLPAGFLAAPVLLALLAAGIWLSRNLTRKVSFGAGFFFLTLVPVLQIVPLGRAFAADRYTYLPSIGLSYLAGEGFSRLLEKSAAVKNLRPVLWFIVLCAAAALSWLTWSRTMVWNNSFTLWDDVIAKYPGAAVAHNNRGFAFAEAGDHSRALENYRRSLELDPGDAEYALNYAGALYNLGRLDEAVSVCRKILTLGPNHEVHNNMGLALFKQGKAQEAMEHYREAIRLKPDYALARVNLGVALAETGRLEEAIAQYREALHSDPYDPEAYYNLAVDLELMGRLDEAARNYRRVLSLLPGHAPSTANLRRVLAKGGK